MIGNSFENKYSFNQIYLDKERGCFISSSHLRAELLVIGNGEEEVVVTHDFVDQALVSPKKCKNPLGLGCV